MIIVLPLVGCTRCSDQEKVKASLPDAAASASAIPSAMVEGSPSEAGGPGAAGAAGRAVILPRQVPAGPAPNGTWTVEFGLERVAGDENLTWSAAIAHCAEQKKTLCLETQWQRACELDATIGQLESWTLTADATGAAVRGGADGCKNRSLHPIDEPSPTRGGLCCDRAVAITGDDDSDEFRTMASKRVIEFETTMREANPESLGKAFASKLSLEGDELDRDAALSRLAEERKADPERQLCYDRCNIRLNSDETPAPLIADCGVILRSQGKIRGYPQRIVFASATGPVKYLGDPKAMKTKEQKERVKTFLPSE
jgi:hypothetical protein